MAIQPIDLQTLFTQIDKIGKSQNALREGLVIQQDIHGAQMQRKAEQASHSVNNIKETSEGPDKVKDRRESKGEQGSAKKNQQEEDESSEETKQTAVIKDPLLGKNIDISM